MAIYRRFKVQQKYVNGQPTEEYRLGVEIDSTDYNSLEECNRGSECTELEYRWVDMESADDYICDGTNKYKKQMKQQKCVTEEAWTNVYPYEYQKGELIEQNSIDCGYSPTGEYYIYGVTDGHGSISISPSKEYYSSTDIVTITALPSTDYMFSQYNYGRNLNYGSVAYSSVLSLTMSNNWYVSAVFKSAQYKVYDLTTFGGSLSISPSKEYYNPTDIVTITAIPNINYSFSNYSYGSTSEYGQNTTNSNLTLTMSNDWYVRGNFVFETVSGGSLYYSYYTGSESWYNWSKSTLSKGDNSGTRASIIIDYGGTVQTISQHRAFYSQSYLMSISLPNCSEVGTEAFAYCPNLSSVNLPNCLYISISAFAHCSKLVSIDFPKCTSLRDGYTFKYCESLTTVNLPNCTEIPDDTFNNCILLNYVNLPLCTEVGITAFEYCHSLTYIDLPNCSWVWHSAFADCYLLSYVNLPLCNHIEGHAFSDCWALSSIDLPNCLYVNEFTFENCYSLISVSLPNCEFIGGYVFYGCSLLSSIDLPNCTEVESYAFASCHKLSIVHLPKVTYIGTHVFASNTPIETLYMDQITSVPSGGDPLIGAISHLKSIIIPCSLVDDFTKHSIWGKYSRYYVCTGGSEESDLKEIFTSTDGGGTITLDPEGGKYYSGTTVNIGYSANPGYAFSYFQYGSTPAYGSTVLDESFSLVMSQNWYVSVNFDYRTASSGNLYYSYYDGTESWYEWSKSTLSKGDNSGTMASIIIDYGGVIQSLPSEAFIMHSYLTSISISNCTYVGHGAFANTSLPFIDLPNCSYLESGVFAGCKALTSISLPNCSYIGNKAFAFCYSLSSVNLPLCTYVGSSTLDHCSALQSVNLPLCEYIGAFAFSHCWALSSISLQNCSYVNAGAFYDCSALQYIDLPNCSYIGNFAFSHCQNLPSIDLPNCIYVETYAFDFCSKLSIVHLPKVTYFGSEVFLSAHVETLYMEQITSVPSGGDPNIEISYIKSIFIPSSLLDSFVSHPIWSNYSSYFVCV